MRIPNRESLLNSNINNRVVSIIHSIENLFLRFSWLTLVLRFVIFYFYFCKVEFYQPSCWLYSVPNLLVF